MEDPLFRMWSGAWYMILLYDHKRQKAIDGVELSGNARDAAISILRTRKKKRHFFL
jgi:hypothetical protein